MNTNSKNNKRFYILKGVKFFFLAILFVFIVGSVVMLLWNNIMPTIFGLGVITYWQAIGILVLSKILFGGFGKGGCGRGRHTWKRHMKARWANMSDEERMEMKSKFKHRFGHRFESDEDEFRRDRNEDEAED